MKNARLPLGFTFSFPCKQTSLDAVSLFHFFTFAKTCSQLKADAFDAADFGTVPQQKLDLKKVTRPLFQETLVLLSDL